MDPLHESQPSRPHVVRILLVDDHPMVRERLAEAIQREPDLQVCAEAGDRSSALKAVETTRPDLAIIDLSLRDSSGLELIKDIHSRWPRMLMLVVSMHDERLYAERVLRAGARGYITKQEATRNIMLAVRQVLDGRVYLNDKTATAVIARLAANPRTRETDLSDVLTDRELQVFEFTGNGLDTREIAERLSIDVKTVETYRARIKEKLELKSSSEFRQLAIRWAQNR